MSVAVAFGSAVSGCAGSGCTGSAWLETDCTEAAPPSPSAARDRLRPVAGSKTCIARESTQSSASWPSAMRVAASSLATMVSPPAPESARPESRASSSSSAELTPRPTSREK